MRFKKANIKRVFDNAERQGHDRKKLVYINNAVKENIKVYLSQYRIMTDAVQLKDAWVCNIGIEFAIYTLSLIHI